VELIALIARYHRKSEPRSKHPEFATLDSSDQHLVRVLAGLLRVATGLDRNHASRVASVEVEDSKQRLTVRAVPTNGADINLELYAAAQRKDLLEAVLEVPVTLS